MRRIFRCSLQQLPEIAPVRALVGEYIQPALMHTHAYRESQLCVCPCASVARVSYLDNWIMDELLAAGVYVVQVYNLIISPPLASYLRATRFRPAGGTLVYVARRTSICIMRVRARSHTRVYSICSGVTWCTRERERTSRRCERSRRILVIDSSSDYLWLHALLDGRIVPLSSPGIPPPSASVRVSTHARVSQFSRENLEETRRDGSCVYRENRYLYIKQNHEKLLKSISRGKWEYRAIQE